MYLLYFIAKLLSTACLPGSGVRERVLKVGQKHLTESIKLHFHAFQLQSIHQKTLFKIVQLLPASHMIFNLEQKHFPQQIKASRKKIWPK